VHDVGHDHGVKATALDLGQDLARETVGQHGRLRDGWLQPGGASGVSSPDINTVTPPRHRATRSPKKISAIAIL
jgi:hypothetical protein